MFKELDGSFEKQRVEIVAASRPGNITADAILIPQPSGDHDCQAVAVYIEMRHVGHIPDEISRTVRAALSKPRCGPGFTSPAGNTP